MVVTNPNGANQYNPDERQKLCWDFYIDPNSPTFSNGLQSALRAGYSPSHANTITTEDWFQDFVRRRDMLRKAEKIFDKTLTYSTEDDKGTVRTDLLKIQADIAKHISTTLGKNKGYSTRSEITGKDGKDLPAPILGGITKTDDGEV